ncbi:MAG: hypothetical protein QNK23_10775 [Crocinitomicaceae bacterium]|nr:hypothetical protein [Crocinitomicaceae bacterium]
MKQNLIFLFIVFFSLITHAEGLPIDKNGNITVPHFTIPLTLNQGLYLENHRRIELTKEQKKYIPPGYDVNILDVFDPHYADCTCGSIYGIWTSQFEITLLGDTTHLSNPNSEGTISRFYEPAVNNEDYTPNPIGLLHIGISGVLYYKGLIVMTDDEMNVILEELMAAQKNPILFVYLPPKKENEHWSSVEATIKKIKGLANYDLVKTLWM